MEHRLELELAVGCQQSAIVEFIAGIRILGFGKVRGQEIE